MSDKKRNLRRVYDATCCREDGKLVLEFRGDSQTGETQIFRIHLEWWFLPGMLRRLAEKWTAEREHRVSELNRVDNALKGTFQ